MIETVIDTPFSLTQVSYLRDGLAFLRDGFFDVVLLDIRLPDSEDLTSIAQLKKQSPNIPIVVLTNLYDKEVAVEALRQGVQDYLYKGQFDSEVLLRSIRYAIERQQIEQQLRKQKEELQRQVEQEKLMGMMIERIRHSLELEDILTTTVVEVRQFLNTDRVLIYGCHNQNSGRIIAEAIAPEWENHSGENQLDLDLLQKGNKNLEMDLIPLIKSVLTLPIWQNRPGEPTRIWGQIIAQDFSYTRQWEPWEIRFLTQLANSLAIAIQQSELYNKIKIQAMSDRLTGIANRRYFDEVLGKEWKRLAREQISQKKEKLISLVLCDVDFFKQYNTVYGHLGGDDCLKKVAQALAQACHRASDLAARYGGEEFALILPDTAQEGALKVAQNVRDLLRKQALSYPESPVSDYVTVSIGIATQSPALQKSPTMLIEQADLALRQAKQQGRDRIVQATRE